MCTTVKSISEQRTGEKESKTRDSHRASSFVVVVVCGYFQPGTKKWSANPVNSLYAWARAAAQTRRVAGKCLKSQMRRARVTLHSCLQTSIPIAHTHNSLLAMSLWATKIGEDSVKYLQCGWRFLARRQASRIMNAIAKANPRVLDGKCLRTETQSGTNPACHARL